MIEKMEWESYLVEGEKNIFELPEMTVSEIVTQMKNIFPESDPRVVGDPEMTIKKAAFCAGAPSASSHFSLLQRDDIELILIGEGREWEAIEYVRDASQAGFRKAMIILGHVVSEEAGMEYCAKWLGSFIHGVPIHFIPAGDPFQVLFD
jgi:putative NIF3 family GTP cyclohydrolase 1 type 2